MAYRALDSAQIIGTLQQLVRRIEERFPGAGLAAVARELLALSSFCAKEAEALEKPHWPIRGATGILILIVIVLSGVLLVRPWIDGTPLDFANVGDYLQALESIINEIVFLGIAVWFLGSLEARAKRRRALSALHQLRSIAHVVDMHQLTKDPHHLLGELPPTDASPKHRAMTQAELGRYLDYCSEMLSLTSKVAALFVQGSNDPQILAAVDEVSGLTNGHSSKLWQKLTILDAEYLAAGGKRAVPA
jgi:hypothetical protein